MAESNENKSGKKSQKETKTGITVKKDDDISEWYQQIVLKSKLADYTKVSGCIVYMPLSYAIWENIQKAFDKMIKETGHKNVYFPLLIPESLLTKEAEHIEGFSPEVAWVTRAGNSELSEKLAIRPTSETLIYDSYSKWVRSHRDLPLLYNQWCSVVRWEFKHPRPFLRGREFLWQEGHTVHESYESAENEVLMILQFYKEIIEDFLAIPAISGKKSPQEKFAGAQYTTTIESLMPDGRALQMCTSHHMGTNFSKPFDIKFSDEDGETKFANTTSWGLSTRTIGGLILMHGDDSGLILPPRIAPTQVIIVPIYKDNNKQEVLEKASEIKNMLSSAARVELDGRDYYSPGWKFNEHELKGTPLRIEIGMRDIESGTVVLVRRDTKEKKTVEIEELKESVKIMLQDIHDSMYEKAKQRMNSNIRRANSIEQLKKIIDDRMMGFAPFCLKKECEDKIEQETGSVSRVIPFEQPLEKGNCISCGEKAAQMAYFSKSY